MATRQSDVNLVIRAKNEASSGIKQVTDALKTLVGSQDGATASADALAKGLAGIQSTGSKIAASSDAASQAISRQAKALLDTQNSAAAAKARLDELTRAQQLLQAQSNKKLVGPTIFGSQDDVAAQLKSVQTALRSAQSDVTRFSRAFDQQLSGLQSARSAYRDIAEAQGQVRDAVDQVTAALEKQNGVAAANAAGQEAMQRAAARATANRGVFDNLGGSQAPRAADTALAAMLRDEDTAAKKAAASADEEAAALARVRAVLNPSIPIYQRLNDQLAVLKKAQDAGKVSAEEYAAAEAKLTAEAKQAADALGRQVAGGEKGLFGLKPYELQNLGYQINDVVTQLASGTSLMRTLGQQSGQIVQIPSIFERLVAVFKSPTFIGATVIFAGIAAGLKEAGDQAERLRGFQGFVDTIGGDPKQLTAAAAAIRAYGVSAADATDAVKQFAKDGVDPSRLQQFGKAAADAAHVMGGDVKDAAKAIGQGFTGTVDNIEQLNKQFPFLHDGELQHLRDVANSEGAEKARAEAVQLFVDRYGKAADDMRGPWASAARSLSAVWQDFLKWLGDLAPIQALHNLFDGLAGVINSASQALDGFFKSHSGIDAVRSQVDTLRKSVATLQADLKNLDGSPERGGTNARNRTQNALDEAKRQLADAEKKLADMTPAPATGAVGESPDLKAASAAAIANMNDAEKLEAYRAKGEQSIQALKIRNAKYLTDFEIAERVRLAGVVAKQANAQLDDAAKDRAAQIAEAQERAKIQQQQDAYNQAAQSPAVQARQFIIGREGFSQRAYRDSDGKFRAGYGSDTTTAADGSTSPVTANTTTDITSAVRDLDRRIGEFQNVIKSQIGGDRFGTFSSQQQAALTSIAYNYGSLPDRILDAVRHGTNDQIAAAVRGLAGDNGGVNRARRNAEAAVLAQPNAAVTQNSVTQAQTFQKQQDALNVSIDETNKKLALSTAELEKQAGLRGEALLQAQAQAAADKAEADLIAKVKEQNAQRGPTLPPLTISDAQRQATRQTAHDSVATPKATLESQLADAQQPVASLQSEQGALQGRIEQLDQIGDSKGIAALLPQLDSVNARLQAAIQNLQAFYAALTPGKGGTAELLGLNPDDIAAINANLKKTAEDANQVQVSFLGVHTTAKTLQATIAGNLVNAFDRFSQAIASGKKATTALKDAFLGFASDFLRQIAQMILQQLALNAAQAIMKAIGIATTAVAHSGGIVGTVSRSRSGVAATVFNGAMRMHTGGVVGLRPDEVPTILQRGEEVLSKSDPRNILNGGGKQAAPVVTPAPNVRVINAIDADDLRNHVYGTPAGVKAFLNTVRANAGSVKQALT